MRWYVAETYPDGEIRASASLEEAGVLSYVPTTMETREHRRYRGVQISRATPVFPGYVFVQAVPSYLRPADHTVASYLQRIHKCKYVVRLLGDPDSPETPYALTEGVINDIKYLVRLMNSGTWKPTTKMATYTVGQKVAIDMGGFLRFGEVSELFGKGNRVKVTMGALHSMVVPASKLEAA